MHLYKTQSSVKLCEHPVASPCMDRYILTTTELKADFTASCQQQGFIVLNVQWLKLPSHKDNQTSGHSGHYTDGVCTLQSSKLLITSCSCLNSHI